MAQYQEKISKLFLSIESEVGTTRLNDMVLKALKMAIHDFREIGEEDFLRQFYELLELVKNTSPRIALIIDHFFHIWNVLNEAKSQEHPANHLYWEQKIVHALKEFRKEAHVERKKMIKAGVSIMGKNDVILIHSISGSVLDTLFEAKRKGKVFEVIVAEQELEKTQQIVEVLAKRKISFKVVPEYMLSHVESEITKVFLGAVTINSEMSVVCDAGSNAIVSEFHLSKKPIYLFISTRKFSLWKSRSEHHHYKVKSTKTLSCAPVEFHRLKFSHDRVPLNYYHVVITELGRMKPSDIIDVYQKKYKEREAWRKEFFKD
jgi:translation initiation factor 2B subunit (eIF-2B alpha/beta/delta family)